MKITKQQIPTTHQIDSRLQERYCVLSSIIKNQFANHFGRIIIFTDSHEEVGQNLNHPYPKFDSLCCSIGF